MLSRIHRLLRERLLPPGERVTARILRGDPLPTELNWHATVVQLAALQREDEAYATSPLGRLLARDDVPGHVKDSAVQDTLLRPSTGSRYVNPELLEDVLANDDVTTLTKVLVVEMTWAKTRITNMASNEYQEQRRRQHEMVVQAVTASGNRPAALAHQILRRCSAGSVRPHDLLDAVEVLTPVEDEVLEVFWTLLDDSAGPEHWAGPEECARVVERARLVLA